MRVARGQIFYYWRPLADHEKHPSNCNIRRIRLHRRFFEGEKGLFYREIKHGGISQWYILKSNVGIPFLELHNQNLHLLFWLGIARSWRLLLLIILFLRYY